MASKAKKQYVKSELIMKQPSEELKAKMKIGQHGYGVKFICDYNEEMDKLEELLEKDYKEIIVKFDTIVQETIAGLKQKNNFA
jgi:hypothetical protein